MAEQVTRLNNHALFKNLAEKLPKDRAKCLNLITCRNDVLYFWNSEGNCVDSVNIKLVLQEADLNRFVSFRPVPPLFYNVEKISVNRTSTLIALYGSSGLSVLELPDRWMIGNKRVDVSCNTFSQQLFVTERHKLRQIRWHPGSPTDSHLVVLTSDECLRLYNATNGTIIWSFYLSSKRSPLSISLGDTPVNFDFSTPMFNDDYEKIKWPILILWGNGDVRLATTTLEEGCVAPIEGPLRMHPSSEDNYGPDASSILVVNSTPPLVVLSTCSGTLYHCLLMPSENSSESENVLQVIESVELELGVSLGMGEDDDMISCPIHLEKDPYEVSRYFCVHNAGVHVISVPVVNKLLEWESNQSGEFVPLPSVTNYLLCTAVSTGSELTSSPLLGTTFIDNSRLLVLLHNGKLFYISMPRQIKFLPSSVSEVPSAESSPPPQFDIYVQKMINENSITTCPIIKLPESNTGPQEWFELLARLTENYQAVLKNHAEVALAIQKRVQLNRSIALSQREEIQLQSIEKIELQNKAEQIAEKYEEFNEKLSMLSSRSEKVLLKFVRSASEPLSLAEKNMENSLLKAEGKTEELKENFEKLQNNYRNKVDSVISVTPAKATKRFIDQRKGKLLREHLQQLTKEIGLLSKRVKDCANTLSQVEGSLPI